MLPFLIIVTNLVFQLHETIEDTEAHEDTANAIEVAAGLKQVFSREQENGRTRSSVPVKLSLQKSSQLDILHGD